jgi:alpha-L-rhamnosidase
MEQPVKPEPPPGKSLPAQLQQGEQLVFDVGRMVLGYEIIELAAPAGAVLETEHFETSDLRSGPNGSWDSVNRYTARDGEQTFVSTDSLGHHYLAVRCARGRLTIKNVTVVDRRYPYVDVGRFECSDPMLTELWQRAVNTVRLCSEDGYLDCSLRERSEWMGDAAVVEYPVSRVTLAGPADGRPPRSDARLMKNMIRHIAQSQLADGRLKAHHPSDRMDIHGYIEDYSCLWVQSLREVYEHTADADLVREVWPALARQMQWFLDRRTSGGLVHAREFLMFDNPLKYVECEGATVNACLCKALDDAAWLGELMGRAQLARTYRLAREQLAAAVNAQLWDEQAGAYRGSIKDGLPTEPTVHATMMALDRGVVPPERLARARKWLLENYDKAGRLTFPYTFFWMFEELYRRDTDAGDLEALDAMRRRWAVMLERRDTGTLGEVLDNACAPCHNFGAVPAYFLSAYVLGVRMDGQLADRLIVIEPRLGDLSHASGTVVTEHGPVAVSWRVDPGGQCDFSFSVPSDVKAMLHLPADVIPPRPTLDGWAIAPCHIKHAGRWLVVECPPGDHVGRLWRTPAPT